MNSHETHLIVADGIQLSVCMNNQTSTRQLAEPKDNRLAFALRVIAERTELERNHLMLDKEHWNGRTIVQVLTLVNTLAKDTLHPTLSLLCCSTLLCFSMELTDVVSADLEAAASPQKSLTDFLKNAHTRDQHQRRIAAST